MQTIIRSSAKWFVGQENRTDGVNWQSIFLQSHDFNHDVRLYINGDFFDERDKLSYAYDQAWFLNTGRSELPIEVWMITHSNIGSKRELINIDMAERAWSRNPHTHEFEYVY